MELWIRSQDRTTLSKAINLIIRQNRNEENDINYEIVDIYTMGRYETKERALGVLDEIQSKLNSFCNPDLQAIKDIAKQVYIPSIAIYEMPKE